MDIPLSISTVMIEDARRPQEDNSAGSDQVGKCVFCRDSLGLGAQQTGFQGSSPSAWDCSLKHPRGQAGVTSTPDSGAWVRVRSVPSNQEKVAGHTYLRLPLTASLVTIKGLQLIAPLPFPYTHNCRYNHKSLSPDLVTSAVPVGVGISTKQMTQSLSWDYI